MDRFNLGDYRRIVIRAFRKAKASAGYFEAFRRSKYPINFMVLFEDSVALIGILITLAGTWAATTFQLPALDGVASILIGLVLGTTALLLAQETKSLLMGEPADPEVVNSLTDIATEDSAVASINGIVTVHIGPRQVMVALSVEFADNLKTADLETKVAEIEDRVYALHPEVTALFVKPQTPGRFMESQQQRFGIRAPLPSNWPDPVQRGDARRGRRHSCMVWSKCCCQPSAILPQHGGRAHGCRKRCAIPRRFQSTISEDSSRRGCLPPSSRPWCGCSRRRCSAASVRATSERRQRHRRRNDELQHAPPIGKEI